MGGVRWGWGSVCGATPSPCVCCVRRGWCAPACRFFFLHHRWSLLHQEIWREHVLLLLLLLWLLLLLLLLLLRLLHFFYVLVRPRADDEVVLLLGLKLKMTVVILLVQEVGGGVLATCTKILEINSCMQVKSGYHMLSGQSFVQLVLLND